MECMNISSVLRAALPGASSNGRFVMEHPAGATTWQLALVNKLYSADNAVKVNFDFCMAGMKPQGKHGIEHIKKRTGLMTNSERIANEMRGRQCDGTHQHGSLTDGRAKEAQVYPDEFCQVLCEQAMLEKADKAGIGQLGTDVTLEINQLMKHPHASDEEELKKMPRIQRDIKNYFYREIVTFPHEFGHLKTWLKYPKVRISI